MTAECTGKEANDVSGVAVKSAEIRHPYSKILGDLPILACERQRHVELVQILRH